MPVTVVTVAVELGGVVTVVVAVWRLRPVVGRHGISYRGDNLRVE